MMTREGSAKVAFFCNSGANLTGISASSSALRTEVEGSVSLLRANENTLDVEVHDFGKCFFWMCVEGRTPSRSRIRKQYVDMVGVPRDIEDKFLDLTRPSKIRWDSKCLAA